MSNALHLATPTFDTKCYACDAAATGARIYDNAESKENRPACARHMTRGSKLTVVCARCWGPRPTLVGDGEAVHVRCLND